MPVATAPGTTPAIVFPSSVDDALMLLEAYPGEASILAGGTWLMRAGGRGEALPGLLVSLSRIEGFGGIAQRADGWTIGPMVTHEALARRFASEGALRALGQAAGNSANPGVRRIATLGGNIATGDFAAADLVPALVALDASITVATRDGTASIPVCDFLDERMSRPAPGIVTGIDVEDDGWLGAHARLTMRRAGEYPVAIASVAARLSGDRKIEAVRIAVGSVERTARRWWELENELVGRTLDLADIEAAAAAGFAAFAPRDGVDAPSWYRLDVLPHLVGMAFADIDNQLGR